MPIFVDLGTGVIQNIPLPQVLAGGAIQHIKAGWVNVAGVYQLFFALAVVATPSLPEVSAIGTGPGTLTTDISVVTATGGAPPYTFSQAFISGGVGITLLSPTTATVQGRGHVTASQTLTGVVQITVTDTIGTVGTCQVTVLIESS